MARRDKWIVLLLGLILALVFLMQGVELWTDWLWFGEVGFASVFTTKIGAALGLGCICAVLFFILLYTNLRWARAARPRLMLLSERSLLTPEERDAVERMIRPALLGGALLLSLIVGVIGGGRWMLWLQMLHGAPFGQKDPLFAQDVGFYVFAWPFWMWAVKAAFASLLVVIAAVILVYLYEEAIRIGEEAIHFAPRAQSHLLFLAALMLFVRAGFYWLSRYSVLYAQRGVVQGGAGYAEVHAQLPMFYLLAGLCLVAGIACLYGMGGRSTRPAVYAVLAVLLGAVLGWKVYPPLIQRIVVQPNELEKEEKYLGHHIQATRTAYGLDRIVGRDFAASQDLTASDLAANDLTLRNIRLWDHRPLLKTLEQLQEIRSYYTFSDVDIDRYRINGELQQVMLSARELDHLQLDRNAQTWVNEHLIYTHGYGLCMIPANQVRDHLPVWFLRDIPPVSEVTLDPTRSQPVERPEIYYGEVVNRPPPPPAGGFSPLGPMSRTRTGGPAGPPQPPVSSTYKGETLADYLVVGTSRDEFDHPTAGAGYAPTRYFGLGGVPICSFWRKLLFALRFRSKDLLFTQTLREDSRILFHRQITERVRTIAPFLMLDTDPYLVLHDGRLFWIIDAYTTTTRYPYSRPFPVAQWPTNYLRNSVKVVIDAYNGTVDFFALPDPGQGNGQLEPLLRTYQRIFPTLFRPFAEMPPGLQRHLRYPVGLFGIQAMMYTSYHMREVTTFYNQEDKWEIAREATGRIAEKAASQGGDSSSSRTMEPYYVIMRLPQEKEEEFILMLPFTPAGRQNMIAWLCARCDPAHYGEMLALQMPKQRNIFGPQQIGARINQDSRISKALSLWGEHGSRVFLGNLLVTPIQESLLYVVPLYLEAEENPVPQFEQVIVAYGDEKQSQIVMENTLDEALTRLFGRRPVARGGREKEPSASAALPRPGQRKGEAAPPPFGSLADLIRQAQQAFDRMQQAPPDWDRYTEESDRLRELLQQIGKQVKP